ILKERTNLRYMTATELYGNSPPPCEGREEDSLPIGAYADLAVVDVSFISLDKILPALWELLAPPREAVLLVKPQFEVGRERVGKKGVVRDSATQADAIFQVWKAATALGWQQRGLTWSPLLGPAGNIEYLLWLGIDREQEPEPRAIEESVVKEQIAEVTKAAARELVDRV
ncbi:MAG: TlyA family rRNA (cytidine-2'-O)-methyltransferase, partial [Microcoleus sp. T1-bin1]|nr:TlyA family rRNA (cytidine-2'-O)-methyltransferase [Microcoleus sp. T1-bin1]